MNFFTRVRSIIARIAPPLFFAVVAVTTTSCAWLQDRRDENKGIHVERLKVPAGYRVSLLASDMPMARHMVMGSQGTLFVGSMAGNVYALTMNDSAVTQQRVLIKGLRDPSGVAFKDGTLFVADRTRIVRFDGIEQHLDAPGASMTVIDGLPDKSRHDAHAMGVGPDGKLYVAVGSPCDTCEAKDDEYGVILRMNPDGSGKEVYARGIRNSVGFDWHPQTRELWFTENGGDALGLERPNDELNRVVKVGENFGFPYCHDGEIPDPEFGVKHACAEFSAPAAKLGAHVAALGMRFDTTAQTAGDVSMIIARHGSHPPIRVGYDVVRVRAQAGQPQQIEPFLTGFLEGNRYWGRPVDILIMRDGSVLVSDDLNGAIYRVSREVGLPSSLPMTTSFYR